MNKQYQINDKVTVDNEFQGVIVDIVKEEGVVYYEVKPLEFNSFSRFLTIEHLS